MPNEGCGMRFSEHLSPVNRRPRHAHAILTVLAVVGITTVAFPLVQDRGHREPGSKTYRGLLGSKSKKIKHEGGETLLWAGGGNPSSPDAQWYNFTGSLIPASQLQFGIGKDRIRAIDDPLFVPPDDPALLKLPHSGYRPGEKPKTNDEIMVAGFAYGDQARAYPVALLDQHELVNEVIAGKPVTVGW